MSADLEREELAEVAREVACEKVGQCFTQGTDVMLIARAVKAAKYAYLAAATLREKEIATLRARVAELSAKLEAVPVEEMKAIVEWELGLDYPCEASAAIDRWLAAGDEAVTFRVIRPDGTVIDCEPGVNMTDALWNAREFDARLARLVQKDRTNNISGAKKAGYTFQEVER